MAGNLVILLAALGTLLALVSLAGLGSAPLREQLLTIAGALRGAQPGPSWNHTLGRVLVDSALGGAALVMAALIVAFPSRTIASRRFRLATGLVVAFLVQATVMWLSKNAAIDGTRIWFLDDDAMISMRYARHFAAGDGLVWNLGERVEGYTNFLWTGLMTLVHLAPFGTGTAAAFVLMFNVLLSLALVIVIERFATWLKVPAAFALLVLLLCAASREIILWSASGLETIALAVLVSLALVILVQPRGPAERAFLCCALGLLPLVRADGIVLAMLLVAAAAMNGANRKETVAFAAAAMLPFLLHLGFRHVYYGAWLPNTAHLKVSRWEGQWQHGLGYLGDFLSSHAVVLAVAAIGISALPRHLARAMAVLLAGWIIYVTAIGGDAFAGARFFVPILPVLFALAGAGLRRFRSGAVAAGVAIAMVATTPLLRANRWVPMLPVLTTDLRPSYGDVGNVQIGLWLRSHTPADAVVADYWAGSTLYFSDRRGVDFLGKNDARVARLAARCPSGKPGHNKYDFHYSLGQLKPDYVVAGFRVLPNSALNGPSGEFISKDGSTDPCAIFAVLAADETFKCAYRPNVVGDHFWRTVFKRNEGGCRPIE